jgi:hypothetical protein
VDRSDDDEDFTRRRLASADLPSELESDANLAAGTEAALAPEAGTGFADVDDVLAGVLAGVDAAAVASELAAAAAAAGVDFAAESPADAPVAGLGAAAEAGRGAGFL